MARLANEDRRKEKLDHILERSRAVFCRKGFLDVKMKDTIEECGISRGGIYLYFSSVDEVFRAVSSQRNRHKFEDIRKATEKNVDFYELLHSYFNTQKERLLHMENSMLRSMYEYMFTHHEETDQEFQVAQFENVKAAILEILLLGVRQNAIKNDNISALAENFMFTIEGLSILALLGGLTERHLDEQFLLMKKMLMKDNDGLFSESETPIRVLITSGGTSEKIDDVRKIVNTATGRLGSLTADLFAKAGVKVTYVCGKGAIQPVQTMDGIYTIEDVRELYDTLETILKKNRFDCVVHAMAVSDYELHGITTVDKLAADIAVQFAQESDLPVDNRLTDIICKAIQESKIPEGSKKISSDMDDMILLMDQAPKVISRIKAIQPETIMIGFKLLVGVDKAELIRVATRLMEKNKCDFVLANDLEEITETQHKAMLIASDGAILELSTKEEIAQAIVKSVLKRKGR